MSSPTVSGPTIAESWIHMHQQGYGAQQSTMESGRYTKSTASSRSRASSKLTTRKSIKELIQSVDDDSGMSRDGIYEAFAQVENDDFETPAATTRRSGGSGVETTVRLRRKSRGTVADDESTMRTNVKRTSVNITQGNNESPRARPLNTKKSIESITRRRASAAAQPSPRAGPTKVNTAVKSRYSSTADSEGTSDSKVTAAVDYRRRRSVPDNSSGETSNLRSLRSGSSGKSTLHDGNVIKLADALRDSLIVERKLARQELGLCSDKTDSSHAPGDRTRALKSPTDALTSRKSSVLLSGRRPSTKIDQRRKSVHDDSQRTTTEIISDAKRRLSLGKEKMRDAEKAAAASAAAKTNAAKEPRRRTLSSGSILRTGVLKDELERRRSTASRGTPTSGAGGESYMKPTIADLRRRSSVANGDEREESLVMLATKRRSALASSRASKGDQNGSRASSASSGDQGTPGPDDENAKKSAALRRQSRGSDASTETTSTKTARTRKKSIVAMDDSSLGLRRVRRMSRTESLKEGIPTSPSLNAALAWRKKSQAAQEQASTKSGTKGVSSARAAFENNRAVRKRGKTLPGSLATPPPVQSLLPPMKVEPIKLSIPKSSTRKDASTPSRVPKPSLSKTINRSDASRTPSAGRSGSSEEENTSATSATTPATKAVLSGDRRASLKTTTSRITPVASPRENIATTASPRTRPVATSQITNTRKLSLSTVNSKNGIAGSEEASPSLGPYSAGLLPPRSRKISTSSMNAASARLAAASSSGSSRKNSLASVTDQENLISSEKEKERHRAMSLQERLQAMVAQHAIKDDYANADLQYPFLRDRRARKSLTYDYEDRPDDDTSAGLRSATSALMWEKEIAEIAAASVRGPKSPTTALKYYAPYLSLYERTEILEYGQIYFIGDQAQKHPATLDKPERNYGYDDERGDYNIVPRDHLAYRYEVLDVLGRGSFGQVVKCLDHKTGMSVAIKLIRNKKRFHAQAQTEVKILKGLVEWDPHDQHHNIRMTDYFNFRNHLCIACECLSINLYEFIKANNYRGFSLSLIKRFTIQLLRSLCLLYEHGVIHCDLKPENILLKHPSKSTIKVIDFGSSCFENDRVYTYIQSRFYRSPEVILGMSYNMAIDMWSLGCILAELYTGLPLFPGENEQEQLACIMEILGVPSRYLIEQSARRKLFFDSSGNPRIIPNSRGKKRRPGTKTLAQALRCNDALFLDFVSRCLHWDPAKRMTPEEAIFHDWILSSSRHSSGSKQATSPSRVLSCVQIGSEDTPRMLAVADNKQYDDTELKKQQK